MIKNKLIDRFSVCLAIVFGMASLLAIFLETAQIAHAAKEASNACCNNSSCEGAILVTVSSGTASDGCTKNAAGVCAATCNRCSSTGSSTDHCWATTNSVDECFSAGSTWQYDTCGFKVSIVCVAGGGGLLNCCPTSAAAPGTTPCMPATCSVSGGGCP